MILIISESLDLSTLKVLEWLKFYKKTFVRINFGDTVDLVRFQFNERGAPSIDFKINGGEQLNTDSITSYWYRRGRISVNSFSNDLLINDAQVKDEITTYLNHESETFRDFLLFIFENRKNQLGGYHTAVNNKLIHLSIAKKIGLKVPDSIITNNKKSLIEFYDKNAGEIIIKAAGETVTFVERVKNKKEKLYIAYTNTIDQESISSFPDNFYSSLIQRKINKKFEIRIFYLKNRFFAMAIFSQKDEQTQVDFRRYNKEKANYRVPFNLPNSIKVKLKNLLRSVQLNTGSIDMIYSTDNEYYFLEVNPVGQFGMVSYPCNYNLEKEIALELIK